MLNTDSIICVFSIETDGVSLATFDDNESQCHLKQVYKFEHLYSIMRETT